ncbi:MAG: acetate/propionate family kinase [Phycisphaeraceae bacterium]
MIVLVANLGSTSFKYKLFDMSVGERVLATGAADRIGTPGAPGAPGVPASAGMSHDRGRGFPDHAAAIEYHLHQLVADGVIDSISRIDAIGFKAVHGGPIGSTSGGGAVIVDEQVLATMQKFADVAPAHNPPYIAAMRAFAKLPGPGAGVPQVAAFETAFHQTIPASRSTYAIPHQWTEDLGIRRYGFHGASHRYIATRMAELTPDARRIISCHLGGSSSICAIRDGRSVATSMGLTPQTGLPQSARVGDFDIFALLKLNAAGITTDAALKTLGKEAGLLGISGVSGDLRDIEAAAAQGNARARLAIDVFVEAIRHYIGAYLAVLNGADAIVFTGGIGQNAKAIRAAVLNDMDYAGISLDKNKNAICEGSEESRIDAASGKTRIWVLPTNEELIVARQTVDVLTTANRKPQTAN